MSTIWVTAAHYESAYRLRVAFNDGLEATIDLEPTLAADSRRVFRDTLDPTAFGKFRVDLDTIVWDTGLDLAPEFLHDLAVAASAA
ncbi:MAG: DUF2442 domain-containing protein [Thermoanaerobaculia bacterium]